MSTANVTDEIPQMLPMKKQKYLVENGMRQGYIKGRQGETGS